MSLSPAAKSRPPGTHALGEPVPFIERHARHAAAHKGAQVAPAAVDACDELVGALQLWIRRLAPRALARAPVVRARDEPGLVCVLPEDVEPELDDARLAQFLLGVQSSQVGVSRLKEVCTSLAWLRQRFGLSSVVKGIGPSPSNAAPCSAPRAMQCSTRGPQPPVSVRFTSLFFPASSFSSSAFLACGDRARSAGSWHQALLSDFGLLQLAPEACELAVLLRCVSPWVLCTLLAAEAESESLQHRSLV